MVSLLPSSPLVDRYSVHSRRTRDFWSLHTAM